MIERSEYMKLLRSWKDENVIKVITGLRRCGKSTLMRAFQEQLRAEGVPPERIVYINFEELEFEELTDYRKLYEYIKARLSNEAMTYIFLDEIQQVQSFQKVIDSLYVKSNTDLYITGSNAYLLSGELATLLSGRYVEINLLPFSFAEYCSCKGGEAYDSLFVEYMKNGGLPYAVTLSDSSEKTDMYIEGIYNTIIVKDIEERQKRREAEAGSRKINDIALLKNIARFLASSVGSPVSVKSVSDYITSSGRAVSPNTVSDYISALTESYIFYPAERYDVLGKQLLKSKYKLYISDLGIRRYLLPRSRYDIGFSLENIVYFELRRRGYKPYIGKVGTTEIDFVAKREDELCYFQVTASMLEESTFEREMKPLRTIRDNYPKTVITLDAFSVGDYEGIKVVNAVDWLLKR